MADIKNYGIKGVGSDVQLGKAGGRLKYTTGSELLTLTMSNGTTLANISVQSVTSGSWLGNVIGTQYGGTGQNFSASTGVITLTGGVASAGAINLGNTSFVTGTLALTNGGTGATTAAGARTNLELGNLAVQNTSNLSVIGGTINGVTIGASNAQAITGTTITATSGFVGNVTGTASNATVLVNSRNFSIIGTDATAPNVSFNGSNDVALSLTLATVNSNVGQFGSATQIPVVTVDGKGRVTAISTAAISTSFTIAGGTGTDTFNTGETLTFAGTTNEIETAVTNNQVQIGIVTNPTLTGNLTVTSNINATGRVTGGSLSDGTALISSGSLTGAVNGTFSGTVQFGSLSDGAITITEFINDNTMATASATNLATALSVKNYVDGITGISPVLNIAGDAGTGNVTLSNTLLRVSGTTNEIETSVAGNVITVGLPNNVTVTNNLTVSGSLLSNDITSANIVASGNLTVAGNLTVQGNVIQIDSTVTIITDPAIKLQANTLSADSLQDVGINFNYWDTSNKLGFFGWDQSAKKFTFLTDASEGTPNVFTGTAATLVAGNIEVAGTVSFGTLTDTGNGISITNFVDSTAGLSNNNNNTTIPTSAAVISYVTNNSGDGLLLRNTFTANSVAVAFNIGLVPNITARTYYAERIVINVGTAFSGGSFNHILVKDNNGAGTTLVAAVDADASVAGTYVIELDGTVALTKNANVVVQFKQSNGTTDAITTAGVMTASLHYRYA